MQCSGGSNSAEGTLAGAAASDAAPSRSQELQQYFRSAHAIENDRQALEKAPNTLLSERSSRLWTEFGIPICLKFGGTSFGKTVSGSTLARRFGKKKSEELDSMLN